MKILIAEDEDILRKMMELRLSKEGYAVMAVANGQEALQHLKTNTPDLVITDIHMPNVSGLEVVGWMKQQSGRSTPVIVLSALGQEHVVMDAFSLGADDYITKPFSLNELVVRVKKLAN
jgi:DNA-binding response OmpR family regulator